PPQRFDVIVYSYPWEEGRDSIKRIIGLPGNHVYLRNRQIYVNDQPLNEPYSHYTADARQVTFGPVVVPKKGDRIELRSDKRLYVNGESVPIPSNPYHSSGLFQPQNGAPPMTGFEVFYGPLFPPGTTLQQPLAPRPVDYDCYFVLGDNHPRSRGCGTG